MNRKRKKKLSRTHKPPAQNTAMNRFSTRFSYALPCIVYLWGIEAGVEATKWFVMRDFVAQFIRQFHSLIPPIQIVLISHLVGQMESVYI